MAGRSRAERRPNEEKAVDPNAAERPHGGGAPAHCRGDRRGSMAVPRARQREVRGKRPCVAREPPASRARERSPPRARRAPRVPHRSRPRRPSPGPAAESTRRPPARGRSTTRQQPPWPPRRGRPPRGGREARRRNEASGGAGRRAPTGARPREGGPRTRRETRRAPGRERRRRGRRGSTSSPLSLCLLLSLSSASSSSASAKNHALAQALLQKAAFPERTAQPRQKSLKQYEHSWMSARSNIWSHRSQKM